MVYYPQGDIWEWKGSDFSNDAGTTGGTEVKIPCRLEHVATRARVSHFVPY